MAAFLSKYGVARTIQVPVIKRAVVDFAVGADWTPVAGDVKITKDGGAAANVTNLPTALAMGNTALWVFALTATEMQAARIEVTVADSATKAVEDQAFAIETYGNASAQHAVDLSDSVRAGLTALPNATAGANTGLPVVGTQVPNATAGAASGLLIAGSNAATTFSGLTTGALSCTTITASGAVAFQSTFAVTTSTSLGAVSGTTLTLSGAVAFQSTFAVTTSTSFGAISGSTLTLSGAVAFQSTFAVTGATTLTGAVTATNASNSIKGIAVTATGLDLVLASSTFSQALTDAVWDELLAGHVTVGSAGLLLDTMGVAYAGGAFNVQTVSNAVSVGSIATDAITADSLAADAVAEIQSGLATAANLATVSTRVLLALPAFAPNANGGLPILSVSGTTLGYTLSTVTTNTDMLTGNAAADALLGRNVAGGSSTGRTVKEALYAIRNKVSISGSTLTVYAVDDTTTAWTASLTTDGTALPITVSDPA